MTEEGEIASASVIKVSFATLAPQPLLEQRYLSNASYTGINQHWSTGPVTCPSHDIATAAQVKILHPPHSFFLPRHLLIYPLAAHLARKSSKDQCHSFHLIWSRRKSSHLIIRAKSLRVILKFSCFFEFKYNPFVTIPRLIVLLTRHDSTFLSHGTFYENL